MSHPQLDHPSSAPVRAVTRSGRWIYSADTRVPRATRPAGSDVDLRPARALLEAATRMHDNCSSPALLDVIAAEALELVPADGVVLLDHDRRGLTPVLSRARAGSTADHATISRRCLQLRTHRLLEPGEVTDLDEELRGREPGSRDGGAADAPRWRSLLLADLDSPQYAHRRRLLWYAHAAAAFTAFADLGVLFAGHAGLALRSVTEHRHLERAVDARTTTGQATGILMHRYRLTAARGFEILRRYAQERNLKMSAVAEAVLRTGGLPD